MESSVSVRVGEKSVDGSSYSKEPCHVENGAEDVGIGSGPSCATVSSDLSQRRNLWERLKSVGDAGSCSTPMVDG